MELATSFGNTRPRHAPSSCGHSHRAFHPFNAAVVDRDEPHMDTNCHGFVACYYIVVVCVWIHCCGGGYGVTGFSLLRESQPFELSPSRLPHLRGYVAQLAFVC